MLKTKFSAILMIGLLACVQVLAQTATCPKTPALDFWSGGPGAVTDGTASRLRAAPSLNGEILQTIEGGQVFTVLAEPVCADSLRWWPIEIDTVSGWIAEGTETDGYFLKQTDIERPTIDNTALIDVWMQRNTSDITWSPDRNILAVASSEGILIYAGSDLKAKPRLLTERAQPVRSIAFDPRDANRLYAVYTDGSMSRWNVAEGSVERLEEFGASIRSLFFSTTGQALGLVIESGDIDIFLAESETPIKITSDQSLGGTYTSAIFTHDETRIALGTTAGGIEIFDLQGQRQMSFEVEGTPEFAFSADDTLLTASDHRTGLMRTWDLQTQVLVVEGHPVEQPYEIDEMFFLPDGQLLTVENGLTGSRLQLWDARTLTPTQTLPLRHNTDLSFLSADGTTLTYLASNIARTIEEVALPSLASETRLVLLLTYSDIVVTPDNKHLIRAGLSGFDVVDLETGEVTMQLTYNQSQTASNNYALSADGRYFAACVNEDRISWEPDLVVYDLESPEQPTVPLMLDTPDGMGSVSCDVVDFATLPEGERLISNGYNGDPLVYDFRAGLPIPTVLPVALPGYSPNAHIRGQVLAWAYSPNNSYSVALYDLMQPEIAPRLITRDWKEASYPSLGSQDLAFVSDTEIVMTAGFDGRDMALYDLTTLTETVRIHSPSAITALAVTDDGTWIATAHLDGIVRLWRVSSPETPLILGQVAFSPTHLVFSADGQRLYGDGYTWDVSSLISQ